MKPEILFLLLISFNFALAQPLPKHDLHFNKAATTWDEGIPLGNAVLGVLIWEKEGELRFSLDRSDLWDLRPMKGLDRPEFSYKWIHEQVKKKEYSIVQKFLDEPYEKEAAPAKIPGAALHFNSKQWGAVEGTHLNIASAVSTVRWKNGTFIETYVHASQPYGRFRIANLSGNFNPRVIPPVYESENRSGSGSVEGDDLNRLGYKQGKVVVNNNLIQYTQQGWGGFYYQVAVAYRMINSKTVEGAWSITAHYPGRSSFINATQVVETAMHRTYQQDLVSHIRWWKGFWSKSSLNIPDELLEKQWYLECYKFGSAARKDAPPISLQAVWTADNGRLPPWKGDYHHDLNTQLSYWPSYSGNHLAEGSGYYEHLDQNKINYLQYTRNFFGVKGLNVPGVTTLDGREMGGWIQYSGSPTISAWLAHHYYLQWRYSMDEEFLKNKAYPWISESAKFIENITYKDEKGLRQLPLSSSPEIFNNSPEAWFTENTNYDLALMKFVVSAAKELSLELNKREEANHWSRLLAEFPDYSITNKMELKFAPSKSYDESHRHFSHLMAIHPLGLIKWEDGEKARSIITNSIRLLDETGPGLWTGYSYSWLANLKARAKDGKGAAKALEIFAKAFCLKNSFHVNGDQTKSGYSTFTYKPFTLEGNFAYASGLQEMLLQSYAGFIEVFPAVPDTWKNVSFTTLRAEGAFLVSGKKVNGRVSEVNILSEKGGKAIIRLPFKTCKISAKKQVLRTTLKGEFLEILFSPGGSVELTTTSRR